MPINLQDYKKYIDRSINYHTVTSILSTAATVLLFANGLFASAISPTTAVDLLGSNPEKQADFNKIAYPIFVGFFLILSLATFLTYKLHFSKLFLFADDPDEPTSLTADNITAERNRISLLVQHYAPLLEITDDIEISILRNKMLFATARHIVYFAQRNITFSSAQIESFESDTCTLGINLLITHECTHLKNDLPYFSFKSFRYLLYMANLITLIFGHLPLQLGTLTAATATFEFHPIYLYPLGVNLLLTIANLLNLFFYSRTIERRTELESLKVFHQYASPSARNEIESYKMFCSTAPEVLLTPRECLSSLFALGPTFNERYRLANAVFQENIVVFDEQNATTLQV